MAKAGVFAAGGVPVPDGETQNGRGPARRPGRASSKTQEGTVLSGGYQAGTTAPLKRSRMNCFTSSLWYTLTSVATHGLPWSALRTAMTLA